MLIQVLEVQLLQLYWDYLLQLDTALESLFRIKRKFFPKKDDKEEDNEDIDEKNSK